MNRKVTEEEKAVILDFEDWVSEMEKKHKTVSANIYNHIMRYLNRIDRQLKRDLKKIEEGPQVEVPEKYKTPDFVFKNLTDKKILSKS